MIYFILFNVFFYFLPANKIPTKNDHQPKNVNPAAADPNSVSNLRRKQLKKYEYINVDCLTCTLCDHTYSSLKSLYHHARTQHTTTRMFYPCPLCKSAFTAVWGVTRHMERIHDKSKHYVDKLKNKIRDKGFQRRVKPITKPLHALVVTNENGTTIVTSVEDQGKSEGVIVTGMGMELPTTLGMKLPTCNVVIDDTLPPCVTPGVEASSIDRVVHIVPVNTSVDDPPPAMTVKRAASGILDDVPYSKKNKLTNVIEALVEIDGVNPVKKMIKTEPITANETISIPKSARQKLLEDMRKETEKSEYISNGTEVSIFVCEICQKPFHKQDSYLRHISYCVFDEDRIEADSTIIRPRELTGKKDSSKTREPSPRVELSTSSKLPPSKISATTDKRTCRGRNSESDDGKQDKNKDADDRKTRSKTGSSTPKVFDDMYESQIAGRPVIKEEVIEGDNKPGVSEKDDESDRLYHYLDLTEVEMKQVRAIIDDVKIMCKKCGQLYSSISSLHRHAVRHFGWRRFKCKLCSYAAFHRSECYSHLRRTHAAKLVSVNGDPSQLVVKLSPEYMNKVETKGLRVDKNSPPSLNVVDLSVDNPRRRPPRLSPVKTSVEKSLVSVPVNVGQIKLETSQNIRKSKSPRRSTGVIKFVKVMKTAPKQKSLGESQKGNELCKNKSEPVIIKQEIDDTASISDCEKNKTEYVSVTESGKTKKQDGYKLTPVDVIPIRDKHLIVKSSNLRDQTMVSSSLNKVIVTPIHSANNSTIMRRTPPRSDQSIVLGVTKSPANLTVTNSVSSTAPRGNTRLRTSNSPAATNVQTLQKAKLVNSKAGKTTDVFLLVMDEERSSQTITPVTIASPSGSGNKLIVVKGNVAH